MAALRILRRGNGFPGHRVDGPAGRQCAALAVSPTGQIGGEDVKPWGKIELDYINHDKFRALTSNAICLWHEGKNYCDVRSTDGLIPTTTAKQFRFYSHKSMTLLTTSAGIKPGADHPYAPLWEPHDIGFKMHDYLEHNDSREQVLARFADAEAAKDAGKAVTRERMARWRDLKKAKRDALVTVPVTVPVTLTERNNKRDSDRNKAVTVTVVTPLLRSSSDPDPDPEEKKKSSSGGSKRPIYTSDRFVVFEWMLDDLGRMLGAHLDAFDLHQFFDSLSKQSREQGLVIPKLQVWPWLQAQVLREAKRRGLPIINGVAVPSRPANCRHTPACVDDVEHTSRYLREQAAS